MIDATEQNAWQIHRLQGGKMDHLQFRRNVSVSLLEINGNNIREGLGKNAERGETWTAAVLQRKPTEKINKI